MNLCTNKTHFGGYFEEPICNRIGRRKSGIIATGYISNNTINNFESSALKIIEKRGVFILIVGMAYYEGLKEVQYEALNSLYYNIRSINPKREGIKLVYA